MSNKKDKDFSATKDQLLDDEKRRTTGDFYTPPPWAREGHKTITKCLGPNWRDELVVWDCAAGSANLTRDYTFKELYLSTLYEDDVTFIKENNYNKNAEVFQFDFLNDPLPCDGFYGNLLELPDKIPENLLNIFDNKEKILFLINPPYGTASAGIASGSNKEGVCFTRVGDQMGFGIANQQLFAQFMHRVTDICYSFGLDAYFGLYSTPAFMTSTFLNPFREFFYNHWKFLDGFLFCANEFSGTSNKWGVSFTLWEGGRETRNPLELDIKVRDKDDNIKVTRKKKLYYPEHSASEWVKEPEERWRGKGVDNRPPLSSAIRVRQEGRGLLPPKALAGFYNGCNNIGTNKNNVVLMSAPYSANSNVAVFKENFDRAIALYTARKVVHNNWINQKDEYSAPNEEHPDYDQFVADAHVYTAFHRTNHGSALRGVMYKGDKYDTKNELFWEDPEVVKELASKYDVTPLLEDLEKYGDQKRHMSQQIYSLDFSKEAQDILKRGRALYELAMSVRQDVIKEKPRFHLESYDSGWYQIKNGILKEHFPNEYDEFMVEYKKFEKYLNKMVYDIGFLKK